MTRPPQTAHGCREFDHLHRLRRRDVLAAGTCGLFGPAAMAAALQAVSGKAVAGTTSGDGFGRAKRCILLFMWGGPSQLDTFDMKPQAPAEIRGEFSPIPTSVPGLQICEHFSHLARLTDQVAIVRSLTHDDPAHLSSAHTVLTGHLPPVNKSDAEPPSDRDTPHLGSLMAKLRPASGGLPPFITMPWMAYHPAAPGGQAPGQNGGFLGHAHDPLLIEGDPSQPNWQVPALTLNEGITADRLSNRQRLLASIEQQRRVLDGAAVAGDLDMQQQQAFGLLASDNVRRAFDIHQEPDQTRDRYGRSIHGQCVLLARRLVEHGVPFVSVNWHQDANPFWDTHGDNFNKLKTSLIPPADLALTALLSDLADRGLLEETLVVWVGEFGRRPQITAGNAGREHHPYCFSGLLAGGGVRGGTVYGSSDAHAAYPLDSPVSPHDLTATMLHALGIPHEAQVRDQTGRPRFVYGGNPIRELFG
jgi:hypothetical protein